MASERQRLDGQLAAGGEDESMMDSDAPTRGATQGRHLDGDGDGSGANGGKAGDDDTPDMSRFRARACARCSRSKLRCIRRAEPGAEPCLRYGVCPLRLVPGGFWAGLIGCGED